MRVAIYTRVSTNHQIDKDSLKVQKRELLQYAELLLGAKDCVVFEDAGFSAKNTDRPKFQEMMSRIREREFTHLLVWKIDRVSRNLLDFTNMYAELKALGVTFISKNEQFDTSSAIGEAMLKIILVFAELERNMTSERVSAVMQSRAKSGAWNGGRIPYGYSYDKETKEFSLNRQEALIAKRIFRTYEATKSVIATTRNLNEAGIRTRSGALWSTVGIHKILRNPFYIGTYRYNVRSPDGRHPEEEWTLIENHHVPLIDEEQFYRVQESLSRNKKTDTSEINYHSDHCYIFHGLCFCGYCGSKMTPNSYKPNKSGHATATYGCAKRRYKASYCSNRYLSEDTLANFVFTVIHNLLSVSSSPPSEASLFALQDVLLKGVKEPKGIAESSLRAVCEVTEGNTPSIEFKPRFDKHDKEEFELLSAELKRTESTLKRTKRLYTNGDIGDEEYDLMSEALKEQIDNLKRRRENAAIEVDEFKEKASFYLLADMLTSEPFNPKKFNSVVSKEARKQFAQQVIKRLTIRDGHVDVMEFKSGLTLEFKY